MTKILTIIIPTYNMEKYLRRCLDSLIINEEGMKQLEVLVINDGSKDSSSQIAHEYQDKYPDTFRVIDKQNGNYGSCINCGLKETMGKYVKILDADDWFDNIAFKDYFNQLLEIDCDAIINDYSIVDEKGIITSKISYNLKEKKIFGFEDVPKKIAMHAITYRTRILHSISYNQTEGISYTDQEWMFTPMLYVLNVYTTGCDLYRYLVGREGQTVSQESVVKNVKHSMIGLWKMIETLSKIDVDSQHCSYANYRIEQRLKGIYSICLFNKKAKIEELIDFDTRLKKMYPNLYVTSESIKYKHFKFIKFWRKHQYKKFGYIERVILSI